jgi:hypothetical protein
MWRACWLSAGVSSGISLHINKCAIQRFIVIPAIPEDQDSVSIFLIFKIFNRVRALALKRNIQDPLSRIERLWVYSGDIADCARRQDGCSGSLFDYAVFLQDNRERRGLHRLPYPQPTTLRQRCFSVLPRREETA